MLIWVKKVDQRNSFFDFFFVIIRINNKNNYCDQMYEEKLKKFVQSCYYSLNGKVKAKDWYENNQERCQKQAWNHYRNLSGEE